MGGRLLEYFSLHCPFTHQEIPDDCDDRRRVLSARDGMGRHTSKQEGTLRVVVGCIKTNMISRAKLSEPGFHEDHVSFPNSQYE